VSAAAYVRCAVAWGSVATTDPDLGTGPLRAVRTGRHACFDRVVLEVDGPAGGKSATYVPVVRQDGSGAPLTVPGGARLQIALHHPSYDDAGRPTYSAAPPDVRGYPAYGSVVFGGSFEGYTTIGVGTRARLPYRRFTLDGGPDGPSRIVLDVAPRW